MQREQGGECVVSSVSHTALAFILSANPLGETKDWRVCFFKLPSFTGIQRMSSVNLSEPLGNSSV